jgi:hypothetical protein
VPAVRRPSDPAVGTRGESQATDHSTARPREEAPVPDASQAEPELDALKSAALRALTDTPECDPYLRIALIK